MTLRHAGRQEMDAGEVAPALDHAVGRSARGVEDFSEHAGPFIGGDFQPMHGIDRERPDSFGQDARQVDRQGAAGGNVADGLEEQRHRCSTNE